MNFQNKNALIYFAQNGKLENVTDMCIAAHQDDVEIMAYGPISDCYENSQRNFCGVVVTDGAGSPRTGEFADYTDEQMKKVRIDEQKAAADIGKYEAVIQLGYSSNEIKDKNNKSSVDDIFNILMSAQPQNLYTHNLADKHPTHVAVALRTIEAVNRMPKNMRPKTFVALEVWRDLDWLSDDDKVCQDTSKYPELATKLLTVHRSQVVGGKSYDKAAVGRRYANATFYASHNTDSTDSISFGIDLMPMIENDIPPQQFIKSHIEKFSQITTTTIDKLI